MNILRLIQLEFKMMWRDPAEWLSALLFLSATAYLLYSGFQRMRQETWVIMFWIVTLFVASVFTARIFSFEDGRQKYFFFLLAKAEEIYFAKLIFIASLLFSSELVLLILFSVFFKSPLTFSLMTFGILFIGALSIANIFCFVSALIGAGGKKMNYSAILGFPIVVPVLLLLIRLFYSHVGLLDDGQVMQDFISLLGVDMLLIGLGFILFPLIWRS